MSVEPVTTESGQGCLHLFCQPGAAVDPDAIRCAVDGYRDDRHQVVTVATLGHKADLAVLALGPDLWRLRRLQRDLQRAGLVIVDSFVSMTEVSEYAAGVPDEMKQMRLFPELPPDGLNAWCFYPMSKRREGHANWFTLPFDDRRDLMYEHGTSGRKFRGRIVQLITGSTGVDDWEWGVTLFGRHLDDLKDCVYSMRFDTASALYAEFGPFVTGLVAPLDDVLREVGLDGD